MILFHANNLNSIFTQHYGFAMTTKNRIIKRLHKWVLIKIKKKKIFYFFSGALGREARQRSTMVKKIQ